MAFLVFSCSVPVSLCVCARFLTVGFRLISTPSSVSSSACSIRTAALHLLPGSSLHSSPTRLLSNLSLLLMILPGSFAKHYLTHLKCKPLPLTSLSNCLTSAHQPHPHHLRSWWTRHNCSRSVSFTFDQWFILLWFWICSFYYCVWYFLSVLFGGMSSVTSCFLFPPLMLVVNVGHNGSTGSLLTCVVFVNLLHVCLLCIFLHVFPVWSFVPDPISSLCVALFLWILTIFRWFCFYCSDSDWIDTLPALTPCKPFFVLGIHLNKSKEKAALPTVSCLSAYGCKALFWRPALVHTSYKHAMIMWTGV